jgi:GntR family transcriptional regulator/MocR family aminotransferase
VRIPVDENGILTEVLAEICSTQSIRLLYITPHHHYPTTVTLSAERRMKLLQLADKYGFVILEDDYDYDYHYTGSPILPLASADTNGMVIYVGSLSKIIAPAIRIGYVVAPRNLIDELAFLRRIIDRQGDTILEQAVAELFAEGEIKRHLKKTQRIYHQRRDYCAALLQKVDKNTLDFQIPNGGMAFWTHFSPTINLQQLAQKAQKAGLYLGNGLGYNAANQAVNSVRMGFASLELAEMEEAVAKLKYLLQ